MTPLDDELRRTLAARAAAVTPPPDPVAGIEQRARQLRRRRALGVVASAALAVAAVALVVPAVVDRGPAAPPRLASPSATATNHPAVLDPAKPWALRGDETLLADGTLDEVRQAWASRHPGSTLTPLFVQTWEPSGQTEIAFVASGDGTVRVGWAKEGESGAEIVQDEVVKMPEPAFQFALPGDEGVTRLYVVAAPDSRVLYAGDGVTYRDVTQVFVRHADGPGGRSTTSLGGIGVTAVETSAARVRVTAADGTVVYEADARGAPSAAPANLLDWPARGSASLSPSVDDLKTAFARAQGDPPGLAVHYRALFSGAYGSEVRVTVGQVWFDGDSWADTVSYTTGGTKGPVLRQYHRTPERPAAVVALVQDLPRSPGDLLVVVPVPGTGQVSYAAGPTGDFRPVTGQDELDGVVLIARAPDAAEDRLEILDGNGDLDRPLYRGLVDAFLCESDRTCLSPAH